MDDAADYKPTDQSEQTDYIDIVFDGSPKPKPGRFVGALNSAGQSIVAGSWSHRQDGCVVLRVRIPRKSGNDARFTFSDSCESKFDDSERGLA